jgi:hypothetical protein
MRVLICQPREGIEIELILGFMLVRFELIAPLTY